MNPRQWKRLRHVDASLKERAPVIHRELFHVLASEVAFRYAETLPPYPNKLTKESLLEWLPKFDIPDPTEVGSVGKYFLYAQAKALVAKYDYPVPGLAAWAEESAFKKFLATEQKCKEVNNSFNDGTVNLSHDELHRMRGFIAYVLRDVPTHKELSSLVGFGPGAALGIHGQATSAYRKLLAERWSVSRAAVDYARVFAHTHPQVLECLVDPQEYLVSDDAFYSAFSRQVELVDHNTVLFVPKTTLTRRSIAVEPLLNNWLQTAVDGAMRRRLAACGNDLTDQNRNQQMAWEGSFDEEDGFCTIDLSSASDSISTELVRKILDPDWFYLLGRLRSQSFSYDGVIHRYEKFCSMGNGFCFPLQTLIFLAACHASNAGRILEDFRAYGDDIIVRKSVFPAVSDLLGRLGFSLNVKKTFSKGLFRESCGGDYWQGVDVRPAELGSLSSVVETFTFHNQLQRSDVCEMYTSSMRDYLFNLVPEDVRFVGPLGFVATWTHQTGKPRLADFESHKPRETRFGAFGLSPSDPRFLTSPHTTRASKEARAVQGWSWKEMIARPVHHETDYGRNHRVANAARFYAALSGSSPDGYNYLRRKTRMDVRSQTHG
jgi:hypothetical protein